MPEKNDTTDQDSARTRAKIRYAVAGLGYIAQTAVLPAVAHAKENSELVALVSGDKKKLKTLAKNISSPKYTVTRNMPIVWKVERLTLSISHCQTTASGLRRTLHKPESMFFAKNRWQKPSGNALE
jgi:hypothetical protein